MENTMNKSLRALALTVLALTLATACTKSKDNVNKVGANSGSTSIVPKSYFIGKTFHLTRGTEDADPQNDVGATPGFSDDYQLVQARITENELQFVSAFDPRGIDGKMKIVASYPITKQFDIVQDKNDFGESTNKTIEDDSQDWDKRAYMRVDWTQPSTTLSKFGANLSDSSSKPPTEENTVLLEPPVYEPGHFSFLVETSVRGAEKKRYVFPFSVTEAQAYRVVYRTHLLEVKPSDFKPLPYTLDDFDRFGFFFTQQNFEDPHGLLDKNEKLLPNLHNVCEAGGQGSCATNRIRWVLSKGFPEKYKPVARRVIAQWNETFKADLNRQDDVVYLDESTQATLSDPSQNVLAYYPDRTKAGLLGVAQQVADPRTGEIVGARATIYGDGIDYVVAQVDDLISILAAEAANTDPLQTVFGTTARGTKSGEPAPYTDKYIVKRFAANQVALGLNKVRAASSLSMNGRTVSVPTLIANARDVVSASPASANIRLAQFAKASPQTFQVQELSVLGDIPKDDAFPSTVEGVEMPSLAGMEQSLFMATKLDNDKEQSLRDAERGIHGTELVEDAAIRRLLNYTKTHTLQDLAANRAQVEAEIAEQAFYTTALHEMGHAFGLRHNFAASADKAHYAKEYYAIQDDLKNNPQTKHMPEDLDPFASSSIMDYGRDFYSQEAGLGDYDRAAIKFAYNRSVNRDSDPLISPPKPSTPYMFCTDHQVNEHIWCRRFDKGSNASEITRANILAYNTNYVRMHYRRGRLTEDVAQGWGSPNALMKYLMAQIFLPSRLVMDEFLYSFVVTDRVPAPSYFCSLKFIHESIAAGEVADFCQSGVDPRVAMEAAHIDPMNPLGTMVNALFVYDPKTNRPVGLRKPSSEYVRDGLADLLFANLEAQELFETVLGAPEPGSYVAMPTKMPTGEQVLKLMPLDDSLGSVDEKVKAFADANGINATPDVLKQLAALTTNVDVGGYGRQLESVVSVHGGFTRTEVIGSWWDKYAALVALSTQGMPVTKYRVAKMGGNPYFFPQSHDFTEAIFNKIITRDSAIVSIPVEIHDPNGASPDPIMVQAQAPAAINIDLITLSTTFALTNLIMDTDRSMAEKLRICTANESQCSQSFDGQPIAQFRSTADGNTYKAVQNSDGDSIAYKLVSSAQTLDDQRTKYMKLRDDANKSQPDSLMALDNSKDLRDKIVVEIKKDDVLANFKDGSGKPIDLGATVVGAWNDITAVTNNLRTSQRFAALSMAAHAASGLALVGQDVDQRIASLGDAGQCWAKDHPMILSTVDPQPSTILDLSPVIGHFAANAPTFVPAVVPTNASGAANAPSALCQDEKAGEVLQNLQALKADIAKVNAMVKTVVTNDMNAIAAPIQLATITKQIHAKETDIFRIRELLQKILPD